jgi:hypothetical protein
MACARFYHFPHDERAALAAPPSLAAPGRPSTVAGAAYGLQRHVVLASLEPLMKPGEDVRPGGLWQIGGMGDVEFGSQRCKALVKGHALLAAQPTQQNIEVPDALQREAREGFYRANMVFKGLLDEKQALVCILFKDGSTGAFFLSLSFQRSE